MVKRRFLVFLSLVLALIILSWGTGQGLAQSQAGAAQTKVRLRRITAAQRKAAAVRAAAAIQGKLSPFANPAGRGKALTMSVPPPGRTPTPGGTPDYFGIYPNYAYSPAPVVNPLTQTVTGGIRKFIDSLPGLGPANQNNLGQFIPIATPDTTTYPGSDYYQIGLVDYTQQMHSDLPATTQLRGYIDLAPGADGKAYYLGPLILARRGQPVRVKFTNMLSPNSALFLPVDTTIMGAGLGPLGAGGGNYSQNRATLHLHGGDTPWISDGTPHQWTTPAGENTSYPNGVSVKNVPDMPDPGPGSLTFFYANQQSGRLMFYHDHAYGITRLDVYAGEAAGYLLTDSAEDKLIASGILPNNGGGVYNYGIPLIIQDKTFQPDTATLAAQDPTWNWSWNKGNLWFPHVYVPNQNPFDLSGVNAMGRWDYGPWFWPPYTGLTYGPIANPYYTPGGNEPPQIPGTPNPSIVPEAFLDTPVVNGTAYPYITVSPQAYRFRILNACNDRSLNLQLYYVDPTTPPGTLGYGTEVKMVPATPGAGLPSTWPTDGRDGGVPDPTTAGPDMIQIGTEGGLLPAPVVIPATPIGYNYNRRDIVVLNVSNHALLLGPAERADVIIDFSSVPSGSKLILYNDAPAPVPAFDPRYDYYTGNPDQTSTGGAPATLPGYGPNTRTIMQIRVEGTAASAFNLSALEAALPAAYAASQPVPIVPEAAYGPAFNATFQDNYVRIQDTSFTFQPAIGGSPITFSLQPKAIQELFDPDYGRMNSTLGVEIPFTSATTQTTIPYFYIDPPTEVINNSPPPNLLDDGSVQVPGGTQIWKITHNGVDTHAIHFHLFNVQLINRVGWDGAIRPPDPNELGWKDTVRMNPLEDAIVALRPAAPTKLPFKVPNSIRPLDVTRPLGSMMGFTNIDPNGNPVTVTNQMVNFGWEYVWHCHLLGHEENDMMRPFILAVAPEAPSNLTAAGLSGPLRVSLTWKDNSLNETGFTLQRATDPAFTANVVTYKVGTLPDGAAQNYIDTAVVQNTTYYYRVFASNEVGSAVPGYPTATADSTPSNTVTVTTPSALSNLVAAQHGIIKE